MDKRKPTVANPTNPPMVRAINQNDRFFRWRWERGGFGWGVMGWVFCAVCFAIGSVAHIIRFCKGQVRLGGVLVATSLLDLRLLLHFPSHQKNARSLRTL